MTGDFDALLAAHEQARLFAVGRHLMPHAPVALAPTEAFDHVRSRTAFAALLDSLGLPQPEWRVVGTEEDLGALGFPVWVKAAFSTAGRGVHLADNFDQACSLRRGLMRTRPTMPVLVQAPAPGRYAQVQGLFDHGRLVAAATSEQLATGAGGSAAARISVDHPLAVEAVTTLGSCLGWHGGLTLDYLHIDGRPSFIECNPRTVEPWNAAAAGVNLPLLAIALAAGGELPARPLLTRPGVRTRSTLAIALGAAEQHRTRGAIPTSLRTAVGKRPPLQDTTEVLTPILHDPPALIPAAVAIGTVFADPAQVASLADSSVESYSVSPGAIEQVRRAQAA